MSEFEHLPSKTEGPLRVLLINNDPEESAHFRRLLEAEQDVRFEVEHVEGVEHGLRLLRSNEYAAVLLDLSLEESEGMDWRDLPLHAATDGRLIRASPGTRP